MYLHLQQTRQEHKKQLKLFRSKPHYNWRCIKASGVAEIPKWSRKKSFVTPLDIIGMPGYDKLTEKEKEMCSNVRLVPQSYVGLRDILVAENAKSGHVKLQRARSLLKIDVNKTRKLYDFLVSEGYINK